MTDQNGSRLRNKLVLFALLIDKGEKSGQNTPLAAIAASPTLEAKVLCHLKCTE